MKVLVTGSGGFIGRNLCSALELREDIELLEFNRNSSQASLTDYVSQADFIFHTAGVNRPQNDEEFTTVNTQLTEKIIDILREKQRNTPLLITSSTQATLDNAYGKSKLAAEEAILKWHKETNAPVIIYRLPGVFGKWSRPNYNSVVATFCNNIAHDLPITISDPSHVLTLAYIDDVVRDFISHLDSPQLSVEYPPITRTFEVSIGDLSERIYAIKNIRSDLIIPNLDDLLNKYLYATYVSYFKTDDFSYKLAKNSDNRGWLAEFVKSKNFGQIFISKTKPGISRGDHWHKTKIEKFLVVEGEAVVTFRNKTGDQDVISYNVSGDDMCVVDIPVGYVHAIKNIGNTDLVTIFWANELLDKENPDTYYEKVEPDE